MKAEQSSQSENTGLSVKAELMQIIDNVATGMCVIDKDFNTLRVNEAFSTLSGVRKDEAVGKKCYETFPCPLCHTPDCPINRILSGEERVEYEMEKEHKDGSRIPCILTATSFWGTNGELIGIVEDFKDITEQKQFEETLAASKAYTESIIRNFLDTLIVVDTGAKIQTVNPATCELLGYREEELIGQPISMIFAEEEEEVHRVLQFFREPERAKVPLPQDTIRNRELTYKTKDGHLIPMSFNASVLTDDMDNVTHVVAGAKNVTDLKQAEAEIRKEKIFSENIVATVPDSLLVVDKGLKIKSANRTFYETFQTEPEKVIGTRIIDFLGDEDGRFSAELTDLFETGGMLENFELDYQLKKIGKRVFNVVARGMIVAEEEEEEEEELIVLQDVTEHKRQIMIQHILYQISISVTTTKNVSEFSEVIQQKLGTILDTKNFFIALYNKKDDTISLPYFKDEKNHFETILAKKTCTAYVIKKDRPLLVNRDKINELAETGEVEIVGTLSKVWLGVPLKVGNEVIGAVVVQSYTDENAYDEEDLEILEFVANQIGLFIERKRSEEELKAAHEYAKNLIDSSLDMLIAVDKERRIVEFNRAAQETFGYSKAEVLGRHVDILYADPAEGLKTHNITRETGRFSTEILNKRKNGELFPAFLSASILRDKSGEFLGVMGVSRDITQLKQSEKEKENLQAQLLQSQKMEAIGQLSGGVAHDFNNLLTIIQGHSQLALKQLDESNPLYRDIKKIKGAGERAAMLTRQLLLFSRKQVFEPKVLDFNTILVNIKKMLERLLTENIELAIDLEPGLNPIKADAGQIEQVVMNLVINAGEAMPQGGRINIQTQNVTLDKDICKIIPESAPGKFVRIIAEDTGSGMDKETLSHIFEPFFTTKKEGTGLGLSVVYGIVKQHNGWINAYSEPGRGSTFKVYFPAFLAASEEEIEETVSLKTLRGRGERILLVEDDEDVRKFTSAILHEYGYIVLEAANDQEARRIFKSESGNFELVFSDVVLPDKTGLQLIDELLLNKPELRVLLSSGYSDHKSQWSEIKRKRYKFLQKPYAVNDLLISVKEAMQKEVN